MTDMNEEMLEIVARNARTARTAAGLSLDALAARADISKGALVALEGARGNPNLTTLVRVADALGRPVSWLMEETRSDAVIVVNCDEVDPLWTGADGGTARLILTNQHPTPVEVWRWLLHPGERFESRVHRDGVTETITVVKGQMQLVLGDAARTVRAGETTVYSANTPHAYVGAGRGPCELIMTVHLPPEPRGV